MKRRSRSKKEIKEATACLAAATEISVAAAVVALLSELDGIFALKGGQRTSLKAFLH